jgi:hypothetical protein
MTASSPYPPACSVANLANETSQPQSPLPFLAQDDRQLFLTSPQAPLPLPDLVDHQPPPPPGAMGLGQILSYADQHPTPYGNKKFSTSLFQWFSI